MPILAQTGRKSLRSRAVIALIYSVLAIGGVTMVVPFIMTVGDSFRSAGDDDQHNLFPSFFFRDEWLYRKYVCIKHGGLNAYASHTRTNFTESAQIPYPAVHPGDRERVRDYYDWITAQVRDEPSIFHVFFTAAGGANDIQMWSVAGPYIRFLRARHATIEALNADYGTSFSSFENVIHPVEQTDLAVWAVRPEFRHVWEWQAFKKTLPPDVLFPVSLDARYQNYLHTRLESLAGIDAAIGASYGSIDAIRLPASSPENDAHRRLWVGFVADRLPPRFFDWNPETTAAWRSFVSARFGSWDGYAAYRRAQFAQAKMGFEEDASDVPVEPTGIRSVDRLFGEFVRSLSPEKIRLRLPESVFAQWLRHKYGTVQALNAAYHSHHVAFDAAGLPLAAADRLSFEDQKSGIFREVIRRNYAIVLNYLVFHGRSAWVTLLLCAACILSALTVNPLAAYALSRYDLKFGYQVLIFFLATMAFPGEVSMIPNFLMLKKFHMLNTLWALFLPGAASGFSIFLLKGFFDSLPRELFEAASLDGASELTVFLRIVLPCSKPVLAVIAMGAFAAGYGSFMWAFVVCQDPNWWTIMVYMFKLNNSGVPLGVRTAALVITSLPTFVMFVTCQKIILQGIVVPQEK